MKRSIVVLLCLALLLLAGLAIGTYFVFQPTDKNEKSRFALRDEGSTDESSRDARSEDEGEPTGKPEKPDATGSRDADNANPEPAQPETESKTGGTEGERGAITIALPDDDDLESLASTDFGKKIPFTATISGTVLDKSGATVADATIEVGVTDSVDVSGRAGRTFSYSKGICSQIATSDAAGNWTIEIECLSGDKATVDATMRAYARGYPRAEGKVVGLALKNKDVKSGIRLTVGCVGAVSGRVVDQDGRGIEGARVTLVPAGWNSYTPEYYSNGKSTGTDAEGNYTLKGFPVGRYIICGFIRGYRNANRGDMYVELKSGEVARPEQDFRFELTTSLRFTLVDPEGEPITAPNVAILLLKGDGERDLKMGGGVLFGDWFVLRDLPLGTFDVEITASGYETVTRSITLTASRTTDLGEVMLRKK